MGRLARAHDPERGGYRFAVGSLRPGDPQISWPPSIVSFNMPKTPGCSSEQIGVVRPALLRSADIEHFCDLTTILVCSTVIQI